MRGKKPNQAEVSDNKSKFLSFRKARQGGDLGQEFAVCHRDTVWTSISISDDGKRHLEGAASLKSPELWLLCIFYGRSLNAFDLEPMELNKKFTPVD